MKQSPQRLAEHRTEARQTGAFTFWFRRPHAVKHVGAWMLNQSADEAAFLTAARHAPRVGERLELTEPNDANLTVPHHLPDRPMHLPRIGCVVRLYDSQGATQRVAIRFEDQARSRLVKTGQQRSVPLHP